MLSPLSYAPELRGWDSNPRSRAHEARKDSRSSTAHRKQIWPAGVEPAVSGAQDRRGGRLPHSQTKYPRRDSNAHSRVEGPVSSPFDHGGTESSGGRARTCASRLTVAHLPSRLHRNERRQQDSNLRTGPTVYALATGCLQPLGHTSIQNGRTPKAAKPTRFRDGVPHP